MTNALIQNSSSTLEIPSVDRLQPPRDVTSTFLDNMRLPVHRWFRYSAGFSAQWVSKLIESNDCGRKSVVLDPFVGSGTTMLASEGAGVKAYGIESHPFVARIAKAKLFYRTDSNSYTEFAGRVLKYSERIGGKLDSYPKLVRKCFTDASLKTLDSLRQSWEKNRDGSPASELTWLTLVSILRSVSHVGTAPWQYVLPKKNKRRPALPADAFKLMVRTIAADMQFLRYQVDGPRATLVESDARTCQGISNNSVGLVITSPPYANNYDYADATRLEMSFMGEIKCWGDLQEVVRQHLIRSCSQHVPSRSIDMDSTLSLPELTPIKSEISDVCRKLSRERHQHGGKKTYHLMISCYFHDMAKTWISLRRVCRENSLACFVIGDSAPYGVYVPVIKWLGELAVASGFKTYEFEKTRDRNVKWKNRKHRVPLCEGRLWVKG